MIAIDCQHNLIVHFKGQILKHCIEGHNITSDKIMDKYEKIHRLGRGGCGEVWLVRHQESRKLFALKTIELDERKKTRTREAVQKEANILAKLKHPHIVSYHESFFNEEGEYLAIIQDYCDGGTLDDRIKAAASRKKAFEESQIMEWFTQIVMAVQFMHSNKVLHRDLKSENVFLTKKNVVKIGDFGISKVLENTVDVAQTIVGTPSYLSPELCQDIPYSSKSDIWAAGCLLYEMCALKPPFTAANMISLFFKIVKGEYEDIPSVYSSSVRDLVRMILVTSPDDRPSASAILNTAILKKHLARFIEQKESLQKQKTTKDDPTDTNSNFTVTRSKPKNTPSPALRRNKLRISKPMLAVKTTVENSGSAKGQSLAVQKDNSAGFVTDTDVVKERLDIPKADVDASSDYSDDFDDTSEEEDIEEEIEENSDSDKEDEGERLKHEDAEYADDFEDYDSSEDLEEMLSQAKEAWDIEAVDDWFADSMSEMQKHQSELLRQQCKFAMGEPELQQVSGMAADNVNRHSNRPNTQLQHSIGGEAAEVCHLDVNDLYPG